jgi:DNA-binding phage protein
MSVLTSDNLLLSRLKNDAETPSDKPSVSNARASPDTVAGYIHESLAENTRTAYLSDLSHFEGWGGQIPAAPEAIAAYLVAHVDTHGVATLTRRLAALAKVHRSRGMANPTSTELVKSTLRGISRIKGTAQRQAKPLIKEDLFLVLEATGKRRSPSQGSWRRCHFTFMPPSAMRHSKAALRDY